MRTYDMRVEELHLRMKTRKQTMLRRRYRRAYMLSAAACLTVVMLFALGVSRMSVHSPGTMNGGAAASVFADHAALGYAVVALLAFFLGALLTVLCHRLKRRMQEEEQNDD